MLFVAGNDGCFDPKECLLTDQNIRDVEFDFCFYNDLKRELNDSLSILQSTLLLVQMSSRRMLSKRTNKMSNRKLIEWFESIDIIGDSSEELLQDLARLLREKYYKKVLRKAIKSYLQRSN
jgi:hypothetical protein